MRDSLTFIRLSTAKLWIGRDLVTEYRQGPPDWLLLCFTDTETATYVPDEEEAAVRNFPKGHWGDIEVQRMVTSVGALRDRLNLANFTRARVAAALAGWLDYQRQHKADPAFLEPFFTVERYGQALRLAISDSTLRNASLLDFIPHSLATLMAPWLTGDRIRWDGGDERMFIRALCEAYKDFEDVTVEFEAFRAGVEGPDAVRTREEVLARLGLEYGLHAPTVVLTEGVTDQAILASAVRVVYPNLTEYIRFLHYSASNRPEMNASSLVRTVKSFAAAGIGNRIVALFDNDGAARQALKSLDVDALPANIRVLQYPDIDLARSYPTLNASGVIEYSDVNGRAASIELYLGRDVLRVDGSYIPVEWKSDAGSVVQAHGAVREKKSLQARYHAKATAVLNGSLAFNKDHWSEMKDILDSLRLAFDD